MYMATLVTLMLVKVEWLSKERILHKHQKVPKIGISHLVSVEGHFMFFRESKYLACIYLTYNPLTFSYPITKPSCSCSSRGNCRVKGTGDSRRVDICCRIYQSCAYTSVTCRTKRKPSCTSRCQCHTHPFGRLV
jgi:hypothetical protein